MTRSINRYSRLASDSTNLWQHSANLGSPQPLNTVQSHILPTGSAPDRPQNYSSNSYATQSDRPFTLSAPVAQNRFLYDDLPPPRTLPFKVASKASKESKKNVIDTSLITADVGIDSQMADKTNTSKISRAPGSFTSLNQATSARLSEDAELAKHDSIPPPRPRADSNFDTQELLAKVDEEIRSRQAKVSKRPSARSRYRRGPPRVTCTRCRIRHRKCERQEGHQQLPCLTCIEVGAECSFVEDRSEAAQSKAIVQVSVTPKSKRIRQATPQASSGKTFSLRSRLVEIPDESQEVIPATPPATSASRKASHNVIQETATRPQQSQHDADFKDANVVRAIGKSSREVLDVSRSAKRTENNTHHIHSDVSTVSADSELMPPPALPSYPKTRSPPRPDFSDISEVIGTTNVPARMSDMQKVKEAPRTTSPLVRDHTIDAEDTDTHRQAGSADEHSATLNADSAVHISLSGQEGLEPLLARLSNAEDASRDLRSLILSDDFQQLCQILEPLVHEQLHGSDVE